MGIKCGIIGLPNVGKSTVFNALTGASVQVANYPFCTIDPNVGIVTVPDNRLDLLSKISNSEKTIHTCIEFVDIAGLVKGASDGEGLGNKFLANIREVDVIVHVVRAFKDQDVIHVFDKVDPVYDSDTINTELILSDMETIDKSIVKYRKTFDKYTYVLENARTILASGKMLINMHLSVEEKAFIKQFCLLTAKPMIYLINMSEGSNKEDVIIEDKNCVYMDANIESEIAKSSSMEEKNELLETFGLEESGLDRLIKRCYEMLNLITFFTSGPEESRAWSIKNGTNAQKSAGKIHTDIEEGFICAHIISYNNFIEFNGEKGAKLNGKIRIEGRDYIMQDGDISHFMFR